MKHSPKILYPIIAVAALLLGGCATNNEYFDEQEYSDMPWTTPEQWEGAPSVPGLSPGY